MGKLAVRALAVALYARSLVRPGWNRTRRQTGASRALEGPESGKVTTYGKTDGD
jgi:hypothetical protein